MATPNSFGLSQLVDRHDLAAHGAAVAGSRNGVFKMCHADRFAHPAERVQHADVEDRGNEVPARANGSKIVSHHPLDAAERRDLAPSG